MQKRIYFQNQWHDTSTFQMNALNSGFYWGESIFETIKAEGNRIPFWQWHTERIQETIDYLSIQFLTEWNSNQILSTLMNELNLLGYKESKIRITFFRTSLMEKHFSFLMEIEEWNFNSEIENSLTIYFDNKKPVGRLSNFKTGNRWLYRLAADYAAKSDYSDAVILNANGYVCESTHSNIFIFKNNSIITPPLSDGMIDGVCRKFIVTHFPVIEQSIGLNELINADEIFLSNAVRWIQPINKLEQKSLSTLQTNNFVHQFKQMIP